MKVKGGGAQPPGPEMEAAAAAAAAALRVCQNCKRDVAAANFSLHEAHCRRFLAICPECEEPVALKDMKTHLGEAHQQVRCHLCHQAMQQYLLESHEAEECPERCVQCRFCELELPFRKLQAHLEACGSRTTSCWDCGKYIMYQALEEHHTTCHAGQEPREPEPKSNLCQLCRGQFPDEQYLQHLNECSPLPSLLGALTTGSSPEGVSLATEEKAVRPKRLEKEPPSIVGKPSLKPPKGRRTPSCLAFKPLGPQGMEEAETGQDPAYDQMVACAHCNILLPCPTLQKHQKKCLRRQTPPLLTLRRSSRILGKGESSQQSSPSRETHGWP